MEAVLFLGHFLHLKLFLDCQQKRFGVLLISKYLVDILLKPVPLAFKSLEDLVAFHEVLYVFSVVFQVQDPESFFEQSPVYLFY